MGKRTFIAAATYQLERRDVGGGEVVLHYEGHPVLGEAEINPKNDNFLRGNQWLLILNNSPGLHPVVARDGLPDLPVPPDVVEGLLERDRLPQRRLRHRVRRLGAVLRGGIRRRG